MELVAIGKTGRPHGLSGELKLSIEEPFLEDFLVLSACFLERNGQRLPHFIEQIRGQSADILKLEQVDNRSTAQEWAHCTILVPAEQLATPQPAEEEHPFAVYRGYQVIDQTLGEIGSIEAFILQTQQVLAVVAYREKEVFLPLHDDLIEKVDTEKQLLHMDLPEGLIDL